MLGKLRSIGASAKKLVGATGTPAPETSGGDAQHDSSAAPEDPIAPAGGAAGAENLDRPLDRSTGFRARDVAVIRRVELRIRDGQLAVPQLSSAASELLEMLEQPSVEMTEISDVFATDPALSGQLLSLANSAVGGSRIGLTSIRSCVVRVGIRSLRTMVLGASMRSQLLPNETTARFAQMAWRQALSVGSIARAIAPHVGEDPDAAFTLGLLHDIGKVPLLSMLADEADERDIDQALVSVLFSRLHEFAGATVAREWGMGDELTAICGSHHDYRNHPTNARQAAFVSLAHQLDLHLSLADSEAFQALRGSDLMEALHLTDSARIAILAGAEEAFVASADESGVTAPTSAP